MADDVRPSPVLVDEVPSSDKVTEYDKEHEEIYIQLLDADARGAGTEEMARSVFGMEPDEEPDRVGKIVRAHLSRARWMMEHGYRQLVESSLPEQRALLDYLRVRSSTGPVAAHRKQGPRRR